MCLVNNPGAFLLFVPAISVSRFFHIGKRFTPTMCMHTSTLDS